MNQSFDYLIVGQGLAGSLLAYQLLEKGKKIKIIDNENGASSSKVAAGIFNPITGKRFVKTWLCDDIFNEIIPFYEGLEAKFGVKFLHKMPIARPVETVREQNFVIDLADDPAHTNYLEFLPKNPEINNLVKADYGILSTKISGWLDIPLLLNNLKNYFSDKSIYHNQVFDYKAVKFSNNKAEYQGCIYDKIIFCEGYSMVQNPFFNWLPFNAVKGELLDVKMEAPLYNFILLKGIFILPIAGHNFKVGATYNWADKTNQNTEQGKSELIVKLKKLINNKFEITAQKAGIRPATIDRRPFLGFHPKYTQLAVFNGLGTKGVSLAPYFAKHFTNFLINNEQLPADVNINRFSSLYLSSDF